MKPVKGIFYTRNLSHWPCSKLSDLLSSFISSLLPISPYTCINICASVPAPFISDVKIHSDHGYSVYQTESLIVSMCYNVSQLIALVSISNDMISFLKNLY